MDMSKKDIKKAYKIVKKMHKLERKLNEIYNIEYVPEGEETE